MFIITWVYQKPKLWRPEPSQPLG